MQQEEIWKDLIRYNGKYSVSDQGNVRTNKHYVSYVNKFGSITLKPIAAKSRKPQNHNCGYKSISLGRNNNELLHRLIAEAFHANPLNLEFVNHRNGIKHDNRANNLEWCTRQENEDHAVRTGLKKSKGQQNTMAKITDKQAKEIKYSIIKDASTKRNLAKEFDIHPATIARIWQGVIWKHI